MDNLLLVEGPDDVHVVSQLLNTHGLTSLRNDKDKGVNPLKLFIGDSPLDIVPVTDADEMIGRFEAALELASVRPKAVGLILDFDAPNELQANNRDIAVQNSIRKLQENGCRWNLPKDFTVLASEGFVADSADEDTPRIGVWLMPNNQGRGMLETFLQQLIPSERSGLLDHARQSTDTAKEDYQAPFLPVHRDKAVVHTFLAWMDKPGRPFGVSFQNGSFDANAPLAQSFIGWMQRLFRD